MKRLLLLCLLALAVTGSASAATTVYSVAGPMQFGNPLTGSFDNPAVQDLTVTATVATPKAGASYLVQLTYTGVPGVTFADQSCIISFSAPTASASCTVAAARVGTFSVLAKPKSGKYGTASGEITVTTP